MADKQRTPPPLAALAGGREVKQVKINVTSGKSMRPFFHSEDDLIRRSIFFRTQLRNVDRHINLPCIELQNDHGGTDTFARYISFIRGDCEILPGLNEMTTKSAQKSADDEFCILCDLYFLCDAIGDFETQNAVVDQVLARYRQEITNGRPWLPSAKLLTYLYTKKSGWFQHLTVDLFMWTGAAETSKRIRDYEAVPHRFKVDLDSAVRQQAHFTARDASPEILAFISRAPSGTSIRSVVPSETVNCTYYYHANGVDCAYRKRKRQEE